MQGAGGIQMQTFPQPGERIENEEMNPNGWQGFNRDGIRGVLSGDRKGCTFSG